LLVYANFLNALALQLGSGLAGVKFLEQKSDRAATLEELDRAKSSFFASVSHELRTPLTLILGPIDDIISKEDSSLEASDRDQLIVASRNGKRLLSMVNTLLDFSALEGRKIASIVFRSSQLSKITADLACLFKPSIERGGVELIVQCDVDPFVEPFYLEMEMWEKVMFNLIGNAFKYCLTGTITVSVQYSKDHAIVSVQDTGCGIPKNELNKIFER
jgi:signal transduction histidine kinase